jgi:hypothetical protein
MRLGWGVISAFVSTGLLVGGAAFAQDPPFQTPRAAAPAPPPPASPPAFDVAQEGSSKPQAPSGGEAPSPPSLKIIEDPAPAPTQAGPAPAPSVASAPPLKIRPINADPEPAPATAAGPRGRKAPVKAAAARVAPIKTAAASARGKVAKRSARASSGGPAATYPGFRMLEGGGSRVFVKITGKVGVAERRGKGQLIVAFEGASVPSRTNRLPLDTSFFPTPVSQVRLVQHEGGAELVIELRQASEMRLHTEEHRDGVVVMVDFPRPADALR